MNADTTELHWVKWSLTDTQLKNKITFLKSKIKIMYKNAHNTILLIIEDSFILFKTFIL